MLNVDKLSKMILPAFKDHLNRALFNAFFQMFPVPTSEREEAAHKFADTVTDLCAEPMSNTIAGAIDYHVRSISISGTVVTNGTPTTQTAQINSPSPLTNGTIPNTLKIN